MTIMTVENNFSTSQSHRLKIYDQIYTISSVYMLCSIAFVHAALCDVLDGLGHPSLFSVVVSRQILTTQTFLFLNALP